MTTRGRPTIQIDLTETERETLGRWARRHSSAQALALRSRIVLACGQGQSNTAIAAAERCHPTTVATWRKRFAQDRVGGTPVRNRSHDRQAQIHRCQLGWHKLNDPLEKPSELRLYSHRA